LPAGSPKVAVDTAALISLAHGGVLEPILQGFRVVIANQVVDELRVTSTFADDDGHAASLVVENLDLVEVRHVAQARLQSLLTSRIDAGEAACILLAQEDDVEALISDDFRALHQIQTHARLHGFEVGLGAVLIRTLVLRGTLSRERALDALERIASKRGWQGNPIYRAYRTTLSS